MKAHRLKPVAASLKIWNNLETLKKAVSKYESKTPVISRYWKAQFQLRGRLLVESTQKAEGCDWQLLGSIFFLVSVTFWSYLLCETFAQIICHPMILINQSFKSQWSEYHRMTARMDLIKWLKTQWIGYPNQNVWWRLQKWTNQLKNALKSCLSTELIV